MSTKIVAGVVGVVLMGASFYGGMVYGKSTTPNMGQFATNSFGSGGDMMRGARSMGMNGGFTAGEIIASDASSITIKMQNGSTKIVLVGGSTAISKSATGTKNDLTSGTFVTVSGAANSDGSVTAQSVQIRPQGFASSTPRGQ